MRSELVSLVIGFSYLGILFLIAAWGDKRASQGRSIINSSLVYTLSIAVYCTAWTFYGSVGRATETGLSFLLVYLGPTLAMLMGWFMLRKMIRITKAQKITSIADFISARYGKSTPLGVLVTLIAVIGVMPYIALQLKAITISHALLTDYPLVATTASLAATSFWFDKSFWIAMVLAVFIILFGTRHLDASERHEGMVAAIAFESIVKLMAFLAAGFFVVFWLYQGPADLFSQAAQRPDLIGTLGLDVVPGGALGWVGILILSTLAFITLPRQFQVLVIENVDEQHLKRAGWIFPLYLFAINLMVIPIALAGLLHNAGLPDDYVLALPLSAGLDFLPLLVFIGGLSAATGMVIVETIALSTMVSNHLVMPVLLRWKWLHLDPERNLSGWLLGIRRIAILLILLLGYAYHALIGDSYTLVSTGLVSFAAASQFAPALLLGLYWRGGNAKGTAAGLIGGFAVWFYTLLLPGFAISGWLDTSFINQGPWGLEWLKPYALFGLEGWDIYAHSLFWSLLVNLGLLIGISLFSRQSSLEQTQAALFTEALRPDVMQTPLWLGQTTTGELFQLTQRYLGTNTTNKVFYRFTGQLAPTSADTTPASPELIARTEQALTGALGSSSARVLINSVVRGEALDLEAVLSILDTTTQALEYNKRLEQKSAELALIGEELRDANERLRELDKLKDEFVAMVSHELRTPLTSIRAFAEILRDSPEITPQQKSHFLNVIVKESERLSRLIEEILDLARLESGRLRLDLSPVNLYQLAQDSAAAITQLYEERQVNLELQLQEPAAWVMADPDRLQQVLMNLLDNASKFAANDKGKVILSLSAPTPNSWHLTVEDNGTGISPQERDKIFEKFHQVQQRSISGSRPKGSGLGLPISRGIISHLNGKLSAQAGQKLTGARFVIELPALTQTKQQPSS